MDWNSPNQKAIISGNQTAVFAGNQMAVVSGNQHAMTDYSANQHAMTAYSGNQAATMPVATAAGVPVALRTGYTGAGMPSGNGFLGGYGPVARCDYATPANLAPLPWTLDFSVGNGWPGFPSGLRVDPTRFDPPLAFQTGDWDPGLRFWTLPFDTQLTEWLQDLNLGAPAVLAAREFAARHDSWKANPDNPAPETIQKVLIGTGLLDWYLPPQGATQAQRLKAAVAINNELQELEDLMQDDRDRYLQEAAVQSAGMTDYFLHLLGIDASAKPWTLELMNCASAIANMVKMHYKSQYRRVRPSTLCPGLVPPWGPPQHPAFPSGHSMVAHLTALMLLEIPAVALRAGIFARKEESSDITVGFGARPTPAQMLAPEATQGYEHDLRSPLLWLAWRIAKNRERIGVHYPSDGAASRRLAAAVWTAICGSEADRRVHGLPAIDVPTLHTVLARARAEWPEVPSTAET